MNSFSSKESLKKHEEYCGQHENVKIELPVENPNLEFQNFNRSLMVPFMVYADFECIVKPIRTCEPNSEKSYPIEYQRHKPISFCYLIKCFDETVFPQKKLNTLPNPKKKMWLKNSWNILKETFERFTKDFEKPRINFTAQKRKKISEIPKSAGSAKKNFQATKSEIIVTTPESIEARLTKNAKRNRISPQ